jgi:hypothetical protein
MNKKISNLKNYAGGILLSLLCLIWLDLFITSGNIYSYVLEKVGVSDKIISYSPIGFAGAYVFGEVYLAIRNNRTRKNEIPKTNEH